MKRILSAALYTALGLGANFAASPALAEADIAALREGTMKKLILHEAPKDRGVRDLEFQSFDGDPVSLAAYDGQIVVLNFWATWCAPCRKEMPELNALQEEFGGADFQVVTLATGRQPPQAIKRFFEENGIDALPMHRDPAQVLAREIGVLGLPLTVILDGEGQEIARMLGDAHWYSDSARAITAALIEAQGADAPEAEPEG